MTAHGKAPSRRFTTAWRAFLNAGSHVTLGFRSALAGNADPLSLDAHTGLLATLCRLPEFEALIETAPAVQKQPSLGKIGKRLSRSDKESTLRAFIRRVRMPQQLWSGGVPDASETAHAFAQLIAQPQCVIRRLVPLDGLEITDATSPISLGAVSLVRPSRQDWADFFEVDRFYSAPNINALDGLWCLESSEIGAHRPTGIWAHFDPPLSRVLKRFGHWINHINLLTSHSVVPVAMYEKPVTTLAPRPVLSLSLTTPATDSHIGPDDEEYETRLVTVEVDSSCATVLIDLEAGRAAAPPQSRIETAIRFFLRVSQSLYGWQHGITTYSTDAYEDLIADCFTAIEALVLVSQERFKGPKIAQRTAALIAASDQEIGRLESEVREYYNLRNDIVHGDDHHRSKKLNECVDRLRVIVRQVLVAALRLHGDRQPIIDGVTDIKVRHRNRALVPRYAE